MLCVQIEHKLVNFCKSINRFKSSAAGFAVYLQMFLIGKKKTRLFNSDFRSEMNEK